MTTMQPEELREARAILGLTQQQLANALDLESTYSRDTVRAWEKGHRAITGPAGVAIRLMVELHHLRPKPKANAKGGKTSG